MELIQTGFELIASNLAASLMVVIGVATWQALRGCFNFGV